MESFYPAPAANAASPSPYLDIAALGIGQPAKVVTRHAKHILTAPFALFDEETVALLSASPSSDAVVQSLPLTYSFDGHVFKVPERFTVQPFARTNSKRKMADLDIDERSIDFVAAGRKLAMLSKFQQAKRRTAAPSGARMVDALPTDFDAVRRALARAMRAEVHRAGAVDTRAINFAKARGALGAVLDAAVQARRKPAVDSRPIRVATTRRALAHSRKFWTLAAATREGTLRHVDASPVDRNAAKLVLARAHKAWHKSASSGHATPSVDSRPIRLAAARRELASSRVFWTLSAAGVAAKLVDRSPVPVSHARDALARSSKIRALAAMHGAIKSMLVEEHPVSFAAARRAVAAALVKDAPTSVVVSAPWWPVETPAVSTTVPAPPAPTPLMATSGYWWPFARPAEEVETGMATQTPPPLPPRKADAGTQYDTAVASVATEPMPVPRITIDSIAGTDEMAKDLHNAKIADMAEEIVSSILAQALSELAMHDETVVASEPAEVPVEEEADKESVATAAEAHADVDESEYEFVDARA